MIRFCLIVLMLIGSVEITKSQNHINTDTVGVKTVSDNIYNSPLFGDSLSNSFIIIIKNGVKAHKHLNHSEHVVVLDGNATMLLGDKQITLKKGDVIFIPKNTVHSVKTTSKIPLKVLSIQAPYFDGKDRVFVD